MQSASPEALLKHSGVLEAKATESWPFTVVGAGGSPPSQAPEESGLWPGWKQTRKSLQPLPCSSRQKFTLGKSLWQRTRMWEAPWMQPGKDREKNEERVSRSPPCRKAVVERNTYCSCRGPKLRSPNPHQAAPNCQR